MSSPKPFEGESDRFRGITIRSETVKAEDGDFISRLDVSLDEWKQKVI